MAIGLCPNLPFLIYVGAGFDSMDHDFLREYIHNIITFGVRSSYMYLLDHCLFLGARYFYRKERLRLRLLAYSHPRMLLQFEL